MKYICTLSLLLSLNFLTIVQQIVKIEFYSKSTGDYYLMIKRTLNDNGYNSFVNYGTEAKARDLILKYETTSRENYDELHKYRFTLLNSEGEQVNSIEKTISYINFRTNEPKEIC